MKLSHYSRERAGRGFTLIELLVVIAIIVLLVSILMPALSEAKKLAKATACMTNLKSQGHAFMFFSEDHEQTVPPAFMYPHPEGLGRYLHSPYQDLVSNAPANGYSTNNWGYSGQGSAYHNPAKGIYYAPQFTCPSIKPEGDNDDPLGVFTNSAYIHYGIGMWTSFYWFRNNISQSKYVDNWGGRRIDMRKFDDLKSFLHPDVVSDPDAANADYIFSRNFFAQGGSNGLTPSKFCLVGETHAYWTLDGARDENGKPFKSVRYRHRDRTNTLRLDGSARPAWLLGSYGFEIVRE